MAGIRRGREQLPLLQNALVNRLWGLAGTGRVAYVALLRWARSLIHRPNSSAFDDSVIDPSGENEKIEEELMRLSVLDEVHAS